MNIPTGFAQVNLMFVGAGLPRNAQIALGVENASPLTAAGVAGSVGGAFVTNVMPLLSEGVTLQSVKAKLGPNATGAEAEIAYGTPGGATGDEPLPPNVAALVRKITATGGRKGQGRIFVPGVTEDSTTGGGYLTPTALAALQTAFDDFLTDIGTTFTPMVVLHNDATTPTDVTELAVQQLLATQKRRIRRAGGRRSTP